MSRINNELFTIRLILQIKRSISVTD